MKYQYCISDIHMNLNNSDLALGFFLNVRSQILTISLTLIHFPKNTKQK